MIRKTRAELEAMSLKQLKALDITNVDEEKLIQELMLAKTATVPVKVKFPEVVPDIKNAEEEKFWQDKIDKFKLENLPVEAQVVLAEEELKTIEKELDINIPESSVKAENFEIKPFCDSCDSKGSVHKKVCPKNPKNIIPTETK